MAICVRKNCTTSVWGKIKRDLNVSVNDIMPHMSKTG